MLNDRDNLPFIRVILFHSHQHYRKRIVSLHLQRQCMFSGFWNLAKMASWYSLLPFILIVNGVKNIFLGLLITAFLSL